MNNPLARGHTGAIIIAAGDGHRMGGLDKMFTPISGTPLIFYSLSVFQDSHLIDDIVLVLSDKNRLQGEALMAEYGWGKVRALCIGGPRRQDSVRNGLASLPASDWVVVHDGARPCMNEDLLSRGLGIAHETGAAIPVIPAVDTIKEVDQQGFVVHTPTRETLRIVQTPQIFRRDLLVQAHQQVANNVTDDSAMVELLGYRVKAFPGSATNVKVTTPEDLSLVGQILSGTGRINNSYKSIHKGMA